MIADVVVWHVQSELPFDELQEAIQWVIDAQLHESTTLGPTLRVTQGVQIFLHSPPQRQVNHRGGRGAMPVASHEPEFCIIVSNEPVDDAKAYDLWEQYEKQFEETEEVIDA